MATNILRTIELSQDTYNEPEADYITSTTFEMRYRARQHGELKCIDTVGVPVHYTLEMLLEWLNFRYYRRACGRSGGIAKFPS